MSRNPIGRMIAALCWGLVAATTAGAQTLSVHVHDADGGGPLPGVNVTITFDEGSRRGGITAADGEARFDDLGAASVTIAATHIGYRPGVISDVDLADGAVTTVRIDLEPQRLQTEAVVISASRRPEKLLDAPASVSVVDGDAVARRPMLTPSDHLRGLPAVDIGTKGITQSNVAVRGFNDIISGNLRLLTDYRFTQIPSIRYSVPHLLSLANEDVERVEVVSGPGSALYGPNSAHGVVHFLTRSPFDAPGTQVSVGGGNRNVLTSTARHGDRLSDRVAYRVSLQYLRGDDWKSLDPAEPDSVVLYRVTSAGTVPQGELRSNARDFDTEKVSGEAVVAVRPDAETSLHLTAGWGRYDAVELVTNGAVQSRGFANGYGQVRLQRGSLFAQTFVNAIDAGDSYLLRTGQLVDDTSRLYGGQLQHSYSHGEDRQLTYGLDALLTRPDTRHSLHGSNEDRDSVDELGTAPDLRARCGGRRGPRRPDRGAGVRPISDCT